jgi:hypothetical protein
MSVTELPVASSSRPREAAEPEIAVLQGRERRESERVISYWERKVEALGKGATVAALDLAEMASESWAHRFVIAVDPVVENSSLLIYGANFARLLGLPQRGAPHVPMVRQLPRRFADVFTRGCGEAHAQREPVRLEGEIRREDGRRELYRAAFIPVGVKENSLTHLAFGAFNSCVAEPALAA